VERTDAGASAPADETGHGSEPEEPHHLGDGRRPEREGGEPSERRHPGVGEHETPRRYVQRPPDRVFFEEANANGD
jgi:hypothetical protein